MQTQLNKIKGGTITHNQWVTRDAAHPALLRQLQFCRHNKILQCEDSALWRCERDGELGIKTRGS